MRTGVAAALAVLVIAPSGCAGESSESVLPTGRAIETSRMLSPTTHLFADEARARLDVVVDRRLLDPARIRVDVRFEPYETIGGVARSRADLGEYTRLRWEYELRCLTADCIPVRLESILGEREEGRGERRTFRFPPARVRYDDPAESDPIDLRSVSWPPLTSVSRLSEAQADAEFPFRLSPTPLPALSYRVSPPVFAALSLAAGLLLLLFPARAVTRWWRGRHPVVEEAARPELTPLERARALLIWSLDREPADRRRALSNYAAELARAEGDGVADETLTLAWSRTVPAADAVRALAETRLRNR